VAQLEEAAAVTEAEVISTAPEDSETTQQNADETLYPDDGPDDPELDHDDLDADELGAEAEQSAIDAPVSLKAEEKENFAQLPLEAQRFVSDVLQRRDREAQVGLESARQAQRQAETNAAGQIAQTQSHYAQVLNTVLETFAPQPPPLELLNEDPRAYMIQKTIYEEESAQFQQFTSGLHGLKQQADGHFVQQEQVANQERVRGLMGIPEFANEETRATFVNEIQTVGEALGYTVQALAQMDVQDMTAIKRARDWKAKAEKWDAHQKKRNERPRAAAGRFAAAPAGARMAGGANQTSTLKALYPND
jgi:hypothetical protein